MASKNAVKKPKKNSRKPRHDAVLAHASCCVSATIPAREAVAVAVPIHSVAWIVTAEAVPAGLRLTPEPRPPKSPL